MAATLLDALLECYCKMRDLPDEVFTGELADQRRRFAIMGALLAVQEAANAQMERFEPVKVAA